MNVRIHGRNMEVAQDIRDLAEEKVKHAARIFDDIADVDVEFLESRNPRQADERYRVEITSKAGSQIVRVEATAFDARAALDSASDKYERQLRKLKERLIQRSRKKSHKDLDPLIQPEPEPEPHERESVVVKRKSFELIPMSLDEAVLQMEMLGHDFFVFLDAETGKQLVLYRRRRGDLGLIEPE